MDADPAAQGVNIPRRSTSAARERRQKALKHAALARTGNTTLSLLDKADDLLGKAEVAATAKKRHQMRNGACILGIYTVAPLRNASAGLVFGETLFWRNDGWVIDTDIQKTLSFNVTLRRG